MADTYRALLPEGTLMEFQRILELKVTFLLPFYSYFIKFYLKFVQFTTYALCTMHINVDHELITLPLIKS